MKNLFGVPMNDIMVALLVLLGISLAAVAYVAVRNRIMFFIGLRNIPRRPAQTVLIVLGLMLSTLIISAAFTTGDTVDHSLTSTSYSLLGHVDEFVQPKGEQEDAPNKINSALPADVVNRLRADVQQANDSNIDGFMPVMIKVVPVVNPRSRQSEPRVNIVGLDAASLDGFPDVVSSRGGKQLDVASLRADEVFLTKSGADALDAKVGDRLQVFVQGQPHEFTVVDIARDTLASGVGDFNSAEGMVTRLDTLQTVFQLPGEVNFIAISNRGGVRDGYTLTAKVVASLNQAFSVGQPGGEPVHVYDVKRDLVHASEQAGNFMTTFFVIFGLFSIAAGMLLIVMIFVMLAAERKPELGMARAVGTKRGHLIQMFLSEGMAYNMLAALVGAALGVLVAFGMARIMARLFAEYHFNIQPYVTPRSLIISYSLGVALTFVTVMFASWRVSNLNIVRAIRDIPDPKHDRMGWRWLATALVGGLGFGALLFLVGWSSHRAFPFALGFSLMTFGVAIVLRFLRLPERPVFSTLCGLLLFIWALVAGGRLHFLFGELNGGVEMFFLSGIAMVAAATFVLVYNADLLLGLLERLGGLFGTVLPAVKTAVAYPLANKFRTGMTLAMISLIIFALTMMSTMNLNFDRVFLAGSARGGWDVYVDENPSNQIPDLSAALRSAGSALPDGFRTQGKISLAAESQVGNATGGLQRYPVFSVDAGFVDGGTVPLSSRATGYASDADVWQALKTQRDVAVVDRFTIEQGGFGGGNESVHISGIDSNAKQFEPVTIKLHDPVSGKTSDVQVIGVVDFGASASFFGVFISQPAFSDLFGAPLTSRDFISLRSPGQAQTVAREIEAALLPTGAQAESLKQKIEHDQALMQNFFLLMQGFMGLGLFVGIAAVGVIAFRTVVERRQQIGMLRAIGYKRGTVALSLLMESSFVTLLAIASGVALAVWLSFFLITSSQFPASGVTYVIPWTRIAIISTLTFVASLLMTYIPARQAAAIPTAEALRYE